jgi:hypothetical protein
MTARPAPSFDTAANFLTLLLWLVSLAATTGVLLYVRSSVLESFSTPQSRQEWDEWRQAVASGDANMGTVQRKTPKSEEPPTLVLLRDHFAACLVGLWLITSVLYGTLALLVRGVFSQPTTRFDDSAQKP